MKAKTAEKKFFFIKHPVLASIIIPALGLLYISLLNVPLSLLPEVPSQIILALITFLLLVFHKMHYKPYYLGSFYKDGIKDRRLWILVAIAFSIDIAFPIVKGIFIRHNSFKLSYFANGLQAGCCEEIIFRALPVSVMMAYFKNKKTYIPALLLGSLIFGIIHLTNLIDGSAAVAITWLQVFTASASGLLYCAIYIYTGNILIPIIMHSIHDMGAFLELGSDASLTIAIRPGLLIEEGIMFTMEIVIAVLLLRKHKDHIISVWNNRWQNI